MENQNTVSREAITSDMVSIGGHELLEKQNEGSKSSEVMKHRELFDEYKACRQNTNELVLMARMKNGLDVKSIESHVSQLKECDCEFLVRYLDLVKENDALWVVIPVMIN